MDIMKIQDLILVGIPEILLILSIILFLYDRDIVLYRKDVIKTALKYFLSVVFILTINFLSRKYLYNFMAVGIFTTSIYSFVFMFIWRLNSPIIFGFVSFLSLSITEILSYPLILYFIENGVFNPELLSSRILASFPSRCFQLILVLLILKFDFKLKYNQLFNRKFVKLSIHKKINIILLSICNILTIIFIGNFVEAFMKMNFEDLKKFFENNVYISYIIVILFLMTVVFVFKRILGNEVNKQLSNSPKKSFERIIDNSDKEDIYYYIEMLSAYLNVINLEDIYDIFKKFNLKNIKVICDIDKELSLTYIESKPLLQFLQNISNALYEKSIPQKINIEMKSNENNSLVITKLNIKFDDLNYFKFKKYIETNKDFINIKLNLIKNNSKFNILNNKPIITFIIEIPIKEVLLNEK